MSCNTLKESKLANFNLFIYLVRNETSIIHSRDNNQQTLLISIYIEFKNYQSNIFSTNCTQLFAPIDGGSNVDHEVTFMCKSVVIHRVGVISWVLILSGWVRKYSIRNC